MEHVFTALLYYNFILCCTVISSGRFRILISATRTGVCLWSLHSAQTNTIRAFQNRLWYIYFASLSVHHLQSA